MRGSQMEVLSGNILTLHNCCIIIIKIALFIGEVMMNMIPTLLAGAAEIEITPRLGTQIAGDIGRRRPAEVVFEPLYGKALVLEEGGSEVCILSLDLLAETKDQSDILREKIESTYGITKENVILHVVQNHAAPSLGHMMVTSTNRFLPKDPEWQFLTSGDDSYHAMCIDHMVQVVGEAIRKKQRVHVGVSRAIDGRFSFNRRAVMRNGRRMAEPLRSVLDDELLYIDGPVDPEVGVALLVNDDMENIAAILHHSCHPCSGYPHRFITSDWPGAWCDEMRKILGNGCIPIVLNGFCGNLIHQNRLDPDHDWTDYKSMGAGLAESTVRALKKIRYMEHPELQMTHEHLQIPVRQFPEGYLENARKMLEESPAVKWNEKEGCVDRDWWIAMSALDVYHHWKPGSLFDYEIQAVRIGNLGIIACGGEPFVEGQLAIKLNSPSEFTFTAHMCNYYVGYVPVKEAIERMSTWDTFTNLGSKLDPCALDLIAETSVKLLKKLF